MDYDIYRLSRKERLAVALSLGALLMIIGELFFNSFVFLLLAPLLFRKTEEKYRTYRIEQRKKRLLLQFRDLLYELSSSFASGRHMEEALAEGKEKLLLIYEEDAEIIREISEMLRKTENGSTELEVWEDFAMRARLPDIEDFVSVFRVCRDTGGDMATALNKGAGLIGEKIITENDIKAMTAQKRTEGAIITAMPFGILLFLRIASPGYLEPLYRSPGGRIVMAGALALALAACVMIERIVRIEI